MGRQWMKIASRLYLRHRASLALLLLLALCYVGNLTRWTLFFDIDFIFGSIAVWVVVSLYGVGWGAVAGLISGLCTYVIWHHPYTVITFTSEALFVGWFFHRYRQNLVLLDSIFWLAIGMPMIWLFYGVFLQVEPVQTHIILLKQPINGIFNALIATLLLTHLPIHRWLGRSRTLVSLAFQQTLFNLLVAFVFIPTLLLIVLASRGVVDNIRTTAEAELRQSTTYVATEIRAWYQQHLRIINELADIAGDRPDQIEHLQQHLQLSQRMLPDIANLEAITVDGQLITNSQGGGERVNDADNLPFLQAAAQTLHPVVSNAHSEQDDGTSETIFLNVPIAEGRKLQGFIVAKTKLDEIKDLFTTTASEQNVQATLLGRNNTVILSTHPDRRIGQSLNLRETGEVEPLGEQTYQWFPTQGSSLTMVRWLHSFFVQETSIAPNLPWTLVIEASAKEDTLYIQRVFSRNLAIILAITLLALGFSVWVSRRMVQPLAQLAGTTTNLPNKLLTNEPIDWVNSPVTEVAVLVRNFRTMAASLTQKFQELQQALTYEALLKRITDKVRDSLDEEQILHTAVKELTTGLNVECCNAAIYDLEQQTSLIRSEYTKTLPPIAGMVLPMSSLPEVYQQLLTYQHFQFCMAIPNPARPTCKQTAILSCPIFDDQGGLGDLWVFKNREEFFSEQEVRLVQQVANQCAIAIRQARLYQTAQTQVKSLEELNYLKDDFLSTVSHELRTPISNIKMAIQMLKVTTDTERRDRYLKILQVECDREAELINDLLDLQRLTAGTQSLHLEPIQLREWITQIADSFQERIHSREQVLQINITSKLPAIMSDPNCLDRILNELLNNACKYTPPGERIMVSAKTITVGRSTSEQTSADSSSISGSLWFVLDVCNSGVEIPPNELTHIFDKFYRVPGIDRWKQGGTGLGLALVQKMVEHLGGRISVESGDKFTRFRVEMPVSVS